MRLVSTLQLWMCWVTCHLSAPFYERPRSHLSTWSDRPIWLVWLVCLSSERRFFHGLIPPCWKDLFIACKLRPRLSRTKTDVFVVMRILTLPLPAHVTRFRGPSPPRWWLVYSGGGGRLPERVLDVVDSVRQLFSLTGSWFSESGTAEKSIPIWISTFRDAITRCEQCRRAVTDITLAHIVVVLRAAGCDSRMQLRSNSEQRR